MNTLSDDVQKKLFDNSKKVVPGGVHSPVRSFKGLHTTPRFFNRGNGAKIWDVENKEYIDFCMSFGPLILGHKNEIVEQALIKALEKGWSYGACEPYSLELAEFITSKISFIDQIRFVNSGTEAVMTALRLARGYTGKNKIIKFNGCYHGHVDSMLIKAGSGLAGESEASSAGVPVGVSNDTLILELGNLEDVKKCFDDHKNQIAAIIIEPLPANNGLLIQDQAYLEGLRKITKENDALLIFDEVISGFRVSFGGMAELTGITPDIVTYGKVIGGGLPVGAIGAKKEIMETLAPIGPVYQAGTLSANPLAMVGGLETLKQLTQESYEELETNTKEISSELLKWIKEQENGKYSNYEIVQFKSLFWPINSNPVHRACDIPSDLADSFYNLFQVLLNRGIYFAPNAYEISFVSLAHNKDLINELKERLWG